VEKDYQNQQLNKENAMDNSKWNKLITDNGQYLHREGMIKSMILCYRLIRVVLVKRWSRRSWLQYMQCDSVSRKKTNF